MTYQKGDKVHYHPIIGQEHDGKVYELRSDVMASQSGEAVVFLKGKAGYVSVRAISPTKLGR